MADVVITGIGLVTPLGCEPDEVADRVIRGESAVRPTPFSPPVVCRLFAPIPEFNARSVFPDNKMLRLMSRDSQMAVVAAQRAMRDAAIVPGTSYKPEQIGLFGATGLSGMSADEIAPLVRDTAAPDGSPDLRTFGRVALRRIRPVLSFKILANMPICFVSIFENIRGPNSVYTPWEGNGAQAIAAGIRAIGTGVLPCALVGGCDVKTHALSLVTLEQFGVFSSWTRYGQGCIPAEGAAFLVLEDRRHAVRRGARIYAAISRFAIRSVPADGQLADVFREVLVSIGPGDPSLVVAAGDGDVAIAEAERTAMESVGFGMAAMVHPKVCAGDLFAAAAGVQVALAAELVNRSGAHGQVLANCFGYGSEQAAFLLEGA